MVSQSISENRIAVDVAEDVIDKKDLAKSPGIDWRWFASLAVLILVFSLFTAIYFFGGSLSRIAERDHDLSNCRARMALIVTDAEVKADVLQYRLFTSLNPTTRGSQEELDAIIVRLNELSIELEEALEQRIQFEANPILPCPVSEVASLRKQEGNRE